MLIKAGKVPSDSGTLVKIKDASLPLAFNTRLEYSAPARGCWNIVHTGMLIPGAHQIFVCAAGCLRGVVLTAAEMNAAERFSTICIKPNDVLDGTMEQMIVDGVADILKNLPILPPAVLLYTSCIHHFLGCDMPLVFKKLRESHPGVDFTDCYMNPIMRKSGLAPDALMRRQLYSLLKPAEKQKKVINIIGNDLATNKNSELFTVLAQNGYRTLEITDCESYDEYLKMSMAEANLCYNPAALAAGKALEKRLNQRLIFVNTGFTLPEIEKNYKLLADALHITLPPLDKYKEQCKVALEAAKKAIGDAPVAVDYTAVFRPVSLCRVLLENGFNVTELYADSISETEREDFCAVQRLCPQLTIYSTLHPKMRFIKNKRQENVLAIGQKAAYFTNTPYFVNIVENGGLFGFYGLQKLAERMLQSFENPKDTEKEIQKKGLGCDSCI